MTVGNPIWRFTTTGRRYGYNRTIESCQRKLKTHMSEEGDYGLPNAV
jgi:hypothetical protein